MDTRSGDTFEASRAEVDLLKGKEPMTVATAAKVGFRELTPQESSIVRECRLKGADLEKLLAEAKSMGADPRWAAIAQTHFQEGLMLGEFDRRERDDRRIGRGFWKRALSAFREQLA